MKLTDRLFLILSGIFLIALALTWDTIKGNPPIFGPAQIAMTAFGFFISLLGIQPSRVVRVNFYVLCGLTVVLLLALELFLPNSYSKLSLDSSNDFDHELDKFNGAVVFSKNRVELKAGGLQNDLGFVYKKTANVELAGKSRFRIVVLGDSFVMGDGVPWGATWDAIVINYLEYLAPEVEMISFGLNGATTDDELKFLISNIGHLNPDFVVFGFVSNDPHFREDEETKVANRIQFIRMYAEITGYPYRFKSFNFLYEKINNLFDSYYPYYGYEGWVKRLYEKENFDEYVQLLVDVKAASSVHNFDVLFYIYPSRRYRSDDYKLYLIKVLEALDDKNIPYLNPLSYFETATHLFPRPYLKANPGDGHPGVLTNFLAARFFISHLCDRGLLSQECKQYRIETMESKQELGTAPFER